MSKKCLFISIIAIIACVIVVGITVPIVVLKKHSHSNGPPLPPTNVSIVLPLYIYPGSNAWNRFYDKLENHSYSGIHWTVIINPSNGPGDKLQADYSGNLHRLKAVPNVDTVGYVFTGYGSRRIADVEADVAEYASWNLLNGIFFDETPQGNNQSSMDAISYLTNITTNVRNTKGFLGPESVVVHNPGTPALASELLGLGQNFTIIVEDTLDALQSTIDQQGISRLSKNTGRGELGCLIHSVPDSTELGNLIAKLSLSFGSIFLTDRTSDYYNDYGGSWDDFINSTSLMYS
ncbi:hypothetical protein TWF694_003232 [Orbilia ellipsospora]|uniref:Spherulin 4-like cell surface protein n=1 Tax=Orbilia ellipsospora TaxID=2528407 RepID=A0AAV9X2A3_9PEZI